MQINGRLTSGDRYPEVNIEQEAAEMASRILERVRQKSNAKSTQKLLVKPENFRSSDYIPRPSEIQSVREGTISITDRNELKFEQNFNKMNPLKNYFKSNNNQIETMKTPQRSQFKSASSGMQDIYQKLQNQIITIIMFLNINHNPLLINQIVLNQLNQHSVNSLVNKKSDLLAKHRRVESNMQFKLVLNAKPDQLQTPVKSNKEDIVSQLLGSLRNQKKYSDYKNSAQK